MRFNTKKILVVFLFIQIIFNSILKYFPELVETFYSNGIYVFISKLMRYAFGWLPFSVGDLFYTLAVVYLLRWLYVNRKRIRKDTGQWLMDIGATLSLAYFAFNVLWGYNYYRLPLHKSLNLKAKYSTESLVAFTEQLIDKSNEIHNQISNGNDSLKIEIPYSKKDIFAKMPSGYEALSKTYPHLIYEPQSLKTSLYSLALTYMGFSGYLNPFTNEAQVDALIPVYKFPTTACHEVAHQLGYGAENEANFIGYLATIHNDDLYFKYSGYTFALRYCLGEIYRRDKNAYESLLKTVNHGILLNYREVQEFWSAYENPLEPVFKKTFDTFLKANNQSAGTKSYSYVVALLVNYYENRPL